MKKLLIIVLCLISMVAQAADVTDSFPLATGAAWIYEAKVQTVAETATESPDKEPQVATLTWTTEISSVIVRDNLTIAKGSGLPSDLCFYEKGQKPAPFLLVKVGAWRLYVISNQEKIDEVWKKAGNPDEDMAGIVTESELLLDLPLIEGKSYGETEPLTRSDDSYVYRVEGKAPFAAAKVKGVTASGSFDEFSITFSTRPDSTTWKFTSSIGFTGFTYSHHGTTSEVECLLKEFKSGK